MTQPNDLKTHNFPKPQPRHVDYDRAMDVHIAPKTLSDKIAYSFVRFLRFFADKVFAKRYGHRAVVLETVAAVPGMVGGLLQHLTALRKMRDDEGWIRTLLDEAENERMHLMTFVEIAQPNIFERILIITVQLIFYNAYFAWLAISRKRPSLATLIILKRSRQAAMKTFRPRKSRLIIGSFPKRHAYVM